MDGRRGYDVLSRITLGLGGDVGEVLRQIEAARCRVREIEHVARYIVDFQLSDR